MQTVEAGMQIVEAEAELKMKMEIHRTVIAGGRS
jgi:hypothetical protein